MATEAHGRKHQCAYLEDVEAMQPRGQGWLTVTTRLTVYNESRRENFTVAHSDSNWAENTPPQTYYVADVERATIWVDHAAIAPSMGLYGTSRTAHGTLVDQANNVVKELDGNKDIVTVQELLQAAGVQSLDNLTDSELFKGQTRRETGAVMTAVIEYSNIQTWGKLRYRIRPVVLKRLHFRQDQEIMTRYPDQRARWSRFGVRIIFITGGMVGKFVFQYMMISLVAGLALLAVATTIVDIVATRVLPARDMYLDIKYQPVEVVYDAEDDGIFGHAEKVTTTIGDTTATLYVDPEDQPEEPLLKADDATASENAPENEAESVLSEENPATS